MSQGMRWLLERPVGNFAKGALGGPEVAGNGALPATSPLTDVYCIREEIDEMVMGGVTQVEREMPDQWLEDLAVAGEPDECAEKIHHLLAAGADSVVLFPAPGDSVHELCRLAGDAVLPRVRMAQPIA